MTYLVRKLAKQLTIQSLPCRISHCSNARFATEKTRMTPLVNQIKNGPLFVERTTLRFNLIVKTRYSTMFHRVSAVCTLYLQMHVGNRRFWSHSALYLSIYHT